MLAEPELLEALRALSPLAFEQWMAERFGGLGYSVQFTLASGDHGVDLIATREGETVVIIVSPGERPLTRPGATLKCNR